MWEFRLPLPLDVHWMLCLTFAPLGKGAESAPSRFSSIATKASNVKLAVPYCTYINLTWFLKNWAKSVVNVLKINVLVTSCYPIFASKPQNFKRLQHLQFSSSSLPSVGRAGPEEFLNTPCPTRLLGHVATRGKEHSKECQRSWRNHFGHF